MAIKTYINGSANGTITFKGDTEPCAVYVNGERQDNISYIPQEVKGEKSVVYKSEYKNNIRTLSIEGNTYQETEEASPIIEQPVSAADFTPTGSNFIAYYITTEQFTAFKEWATDKGYTGSFKLSVSAENTSEIPTGFSVVAGNSLDDILAGGINTTTIYYNSSYDGEIKDTVAVNSSETVYIGIGNTEDGVGDNASEYLNLFLSNFTLCLQPTEYKGMPSPENPSAVKSSNDSGTTITLQGKNLLDGNLRTTPEELGGIIIQYLPDEDCYLINGTCTGSPTKYIIFEDIFVDDIIKISTIYLSGSVTIPSGYALFYTASKDSLSDTSNINWASINLKNENSFSPNNTKHTYITAHWFFVSVGVSFDNYKVKIQIEKGNIATEYEPYFNKTVQIPSSVTLPDGASLSINLAKVGDKADKLSIKGSRAIYSQNTKKITLTGEESGWSEAEGVYKYSLGKALIENSGYCTHFKLSDTGEENTFGVESDGITFKTDVATGLENFKAWLKAKSDAGDAVTVMVALASPVEYDLTDIDVGQNLLALSAYTKNLANIIKATPNDTANPSISNISVSYAKWGGKLSN